MLQTVWADPLQMYKCTNRRGDSFIWHFWMRIRLFVLAETVRNPGRLHICGDMSPVTKPFCGADLGTAQWMHFRLQNQLRVGKYERQSTFMPNICYA